MAYIKQASVYEATKARLLVLEKKIRLAELDGGDVSQAIRDRAHELACQAVIWEWGVETYDGRPVEKVSRETLENSHVTASDLLGAARAKKPWKQVGFQAPQEADREPSPAHLDLSTES